MCSFSRVLQATDGLNLVLSPRTRGYILRKLNCCYVSRPREQKTIAHILSKSTIGHRSTGF